MYFIIDIILILECYNVNKKPTRKAVEIMINSEYLKRYEKVMNKIKMANLLGLPDEVKEVLKNTTDLKTKVLMLEEISKRI